MEKLLILFTGSVFLSAGTFRIFCKDMRLKELTSFGLGYIPNLDILIILYELMIGYILLFNIKKYINIALTSLIILLSIASLLILVNNIDDVKKTFFDLFTYQPNSMSMILHGTFLVIIVSLLLNRRDEYIS